jgi:hypothetical protein
MDKQIPLRIVRALVGVFAMIMAKASVPAAVTLLAGERSSLDTVLLRTTLALLGFVVFFKLRESINASHAFAYRDARPLLPTVWSL